MKEDWKYCNTELVQEFGYGNYYCPKCGSRSQLVNVIGTCATKIKP